MTDTLALYALIRNRKKWLYIIAIIGASTLIADGIITPSITVVSAIEGLDAISPNPPVVTISIVIISVLFLIQQFGTSAIGKSFGPIMFVWFATLGILGGIHIGTYFPILKAFNPYYAVKVLIDYPNWFLILGAVFLCTTGAEALYSDLGHCGIKNIRASWAFVKTMLIMNYLGQGAWLINHLDSIHNGLNPFFAIMPKDFLIFGVLLSTIAAVIASQALISGSYTIFSEAMSLNFWPRQQIKYPAQLKGQMYIPFVNSFLFVFCVAVIILFQNSTNMEGAYGLSITITMLMTTILLGEYLQAKKVSKFFIIPTIATFMTIEIAFLTANMFKFLHGGWVTLLIASCLVFMMIVWYNARKIKNKNMQFLKIKPYFPIISDLKEDTTISKYATNLVYLTKANYRTDIESKIIYSIINKQPKRADYYWLLHVDHLDEPKTFEYTFEELIPKTLFRINLRLGFKVQPRVNLYFREIINELVSNNEFDIKSNYPSLRKHNIDGDFRFIMIHRIYNQDQGFDFWERFSMNCYNVIKKLAISDAAAYGLDTSSVLVETVPLIVNTGFKRKIKRIQS